MTRGTLENQTTTRTMRIASFTLVAEGGMTYLASFIRYLLQLFAKRIWKAVNAMKTESSTSQKDASESLKIFNL